MHAANVKYTFPKSTQFEENICYVCGVTYTEEEWVGCDECNRWLYYRCVGFNETPSSDTPFTVKYVILIRFPKLEKRRPFWVFSKIALVDLQ